MNHIYITLDEARKVVAALEAAHERGFVASQAVLRLTGQVSEHGWVGTRYINLCDMAHPTDPNLNWGCQGASRTARVVDGKLVYDDPELNALAAEAAKM